MIRAALALLLTLAAALAVGCKPRPCDTSKPIPLQVLAAPSDRLNTDDRGDSWALNLRLYEVKAGAELDDLEFERVYEERDKPFGEATLRMREAEVFAGKPELWRYEIDPQAAHFVTVGLYREPNGDGWYQVYQVPSDHHKRVCAAQRWPKRRRKPVADPCVYLALDDQELRGGSFPPAGFDLRQFQAQCAPVADLQKKKKKKRKKRQRRSLPPTLDTNPPPLPSTNAPSAPSVARPAPPRGPTFPR